METYHQSSSSRWLIWAPAVAVVGLGLLWSGFWYYSVNAAEAALTVWRSHEAEAGRVYDCGNTSFGGYPFRFEVSCTEPAMDNRANALSLRAHDLTAVAQVWDPTLVIGEMVGPLTVAALGEAPTASIDWASSQASLRGTPSAPGRLSIVIEKPVMSSPAGGQEAGPLARADRMEFHARVAADSTAAHPALDLAVDMPGFVAPALASVGPLGGLASASTDLAIVGVLHGTSDLSPRPFARLMREIQAGNGRLDLSSARLQQGDVIASATGSLSLTPRGSLTGELRLTVINLAKLIPLLGLDRTLPQIMPKEKLNQLSPALDRIVPGLGNVLRGGGGSVSMNGSAAALGAAILGGQQTEFEGKQAVTLVMRFDDGNMFLGPLKVGQIAPLF